MATCNDLISGIDPTCAALNKVGGVNKRVWIGLKSNISYTIDGSGFVNNITLNTSGSISNKIYKFIGKRDKNSATWPLTPGDNVNTFNHTAILALYYNTPSELLTIQTLANADDCVVFMEQNDGRIIVLGLDKGINASAGEGGTGTLLNDSTAYTLTLSGEQVIMPQYFSINGTLATLAQNTAYLDALAA